MSFVKSSYYYWIFKREIRSESNRDVTKVVVSGGSERKNILTWHCTNANSCPALLFPHSLWYFFFLKIVELANYRETHLRKLSLLTSAFELFHLIILIATPLPQLIYVSLEFSPTTLGLTSSVLHPSTSDWRNCS